MLIQTGECRQLTLVRLNPGDDILQSLRTAVKQRNIQHGLIISGIGSIDSYHVHVVKTTNLPPGDIFFKGEGPFDVLAITGAIIDGRVHAHITFSDTDRAMGGHLEEGCRILTFGVVVLADMPTIDITDWDHVGPL